MIRHRIVASRKEVRKFGFLFAGIFGLVTAYLLYRESGVWSWFLTGGILFLVSALFFYPILRPAYIGWMKFAQVLAWINTRIILGIAFYLIMTPMGLMLRMFGKDLIDQKIQRSADSYWKIREQQEFDRSRCERLF